MNMQKKIIVLSGLAACLGLTSLGLRGAAEPGAVPEPATAQININAESIPDEAVKAAQAVPLGATEGAALENAINLNDASTLRKVGDILHKAGTANLHTGIGNVPGININLDDTIEKLQTAISKAGDLIAALEIIQQSLSAEEFTFTRKDGTKGMIMGQASACFVAPDLLLKISPAKRDQAIDVLAKKNTALQNPATKQKYQTLYDNCQIIGCAGKAKCLKVLTGQLHQLLQILAGNTFVEITTKDNKKFKSLIDTALEMVHAVSLAIPGGNFELNLNDIENQIEPAKRIVKIVLKVLEILEQVANAAKIGGK